MTRTIGTAWLDHLLAAGWETATIHTYLIDAASTFDPGTDLTLADIPALDRVSGPIALTAKTATDGYFDADDPIFTLATGDTAGWFVAVLIGASEALSPIVGATDERADGSPFEVEGDNGTVSVEFQALGLGRI